MQINTGTIPLTPQHLVSKNPDIRLIQHYEASRCIENPTEIVQEFLKKITQTKL